MRAFVYGRRTRLTHPDEQAFTYAYDALSRLSGVYQGTGTGTPLATFAYATNGLVSSRSEGTGVSGASYGWDDVGRLTTQSDTFSGGTNNVAWTFAYNPASQIVTETRDNDSYGFAKSAESTSYAVNGLNQYTSVGGSSHLYDANGNLTSGGGKAYTYDIENRLVKAVGGGTTTNLVYDPLGRLFEVNQGSSATTTRFLNDGDAMVAELNSSNFITNRFVHGSNAAADDPLVWYLGSTMTIKRWLHGDHLGSIVAVTNSGGGSPSINRYDEYGVPASTNVGRFQYTGQAYIPELGLYYYKARFYSATLGRFMQIDPVGYVDNVNLYAYVGNDPVGALDPTGERSWLVAREILYSGSGIYHLFVVVAPSLGARPVARFSYGPSQSLNPLSSNPSFGSVVEQAGFRTSTDIGDASAWNSLAGKTQPSGVRFTTIDASDEAVITSGKEIDQKLGTIADPGNVTYVLVVNELSIRNSGNSNAAAMAVANRALGGGKQQPLPPGVEAPGWGQWRNVTNAPSRERSPIDACLASGSSGMCGSGLGGIWQ